MDTCDRVGLERGLDHQVATDDADKLSGPRLLNARKLGCLLLRRPAAGYRLLGGKPSSTVYVAGELGSTKSDVNLQEAPLKPATVRYILVLK